MKILELRFKNLNSLYGEWCIDFTHPDYAASGLFAITGATGAGKTTILDALCLALYGQTPRLDRINQSQNEVMSRQTGECFSEVLFEAAKGTFRARWDQQRARKNPGGALQAPKREVANAQGTVLATKLREVQDQIDEITGMSFDRFTRSILLAQGSFDTFLKASADERSPILEQITGTEIYTEISKLVHQRNSTENQTLSMLKAALGGIQLLNDEALEQIAFDLKQVEEQHTEVAVKRDAAKAALDCKERIQTLEKELEANRAEQETLREDREAFRADAERLASAKRAQPLAVAHAKLINLRNELSKTTTDLSVASAALPELEERQTNASTAVAAAGKLLREKDAELKELIPILKQVRALDTRIAERFTAQNAEATMLKQLQSEQTMLRDKATANKAEIEKLQAQQDEIEVYQKAYAQDAELVGQLAAIAQSLKQLEQLTAEKNTAEKAAKEAAIAAKEATATATEEAENLLIAQQHVAAAETELEKPRNELAPLHDGTDWRARLEELRQRIKIEQRMETTRETLAAQTIEAADAANELDQKRNTKEGLQREHALWIENLRLQQKIESLETERAELADGQPCPLCGSLEHPYAAGLPAPPPHSIDQISADLSALAHQINVLTEKQAAANARCNTLRTSLEQDEEELKTLAPGTADEAEKIATRIQQIEQLEQRENEAKHALDGAREALNQQTLTEQTARQNAKTAIEKAEFAESQRTKTESDLDTARTQIEQTIEPFEIALSPETAKQLTTRRDQWVESEKKTAEFKQTLSNLQTSLSSQAEQMEQNETRIQKQAETLAATHSTINALTEEREALFGERCPDTVEQETQTAIDAARKEVETAQTQRADRQQTLSLARQNIQTLEERIQETQAQLDETEPAFTAAMARAGFENEAAYLSAHLDDAEQSRLETRADELKQRHTHLVALETEKTKQLQIEREQQHIETSPEEHEAFSSACLELQQQIGGFKNRIKANEMAKERHADQLGEIEKQQIECTRWNQLHELIGSADGKKFRNFAQGLTFELMVSHANQQLAKMSDRYLLIRDINQPLDLNVIDNYQAGEIRPVKNLSGGESFVVSLSLALGLSQMASKTIRVDSLFLDEGFGTLDEDALETALEALSELRQDGKLIGVISHVGALKERISTQINVHQTSGGRSRLSGTGVSSS